MSGPGRGVRLPSESDALPVEVRRANELERTARTLDMVVRQVSAVWWMIDLDMRVVDVGGPIEDVLGEQTGSRLGTSMVEVMAGDPNHAQIIDAHARALAGEAVAYSHEYRGRQLENRIAPHLVEGEIVGAIGTVIDVTAARAVERRLIDAQRAESLGVLAGGLAHDFNNLLVAILGNADLGLRDTPAGSPGRAALENIRTASLRAAELTDQLLAFAGRRGVSTDRVHPAPLVAELLRITAPRRPANAGVEVDVPVQLSIRGDAGQIRQVLLNLIGNACDALAGKAGTIRVRARLLHHDSSGGDDDVLVAPPGAYVLLEVEDDGIGMDREVRRRVFDPFFTTKPMGHGLGLAAVLGIVRAHGGGLRVISAPGQGSTFRVLWPATTTAVTLPVVGAVGHKVVLVVDDEELVRDVVARMIEDLGYTPLVAADGMTALELAEQHHVDVALVDLSMPRMSGADVVMALRSLRPELPVVLCSGYDRDGRGPVEAAAYLRKPFRMEDLEAVLARVLA